MDFKVVNDVNCFYIILDDAHIEYSNYYEIKIYV